MQKKWKKILSIHGHSVYTMDKKLLYFRWRSSDERVWDEKKEINKIKISLCPHCCIFLHRQTPQRHPNTFKRGISFLRVVHSSFFQHSSFNFHFLCVFFVGFWQTHAHTHKGNAYVWHSSVVVVCATRYVRPELLSRRVTRIFIILIWIYLGWQIYNRLYLHFCSFCP